MWVSLLLFRILARVGLFGIALAAGLALAACSAPITFHGTVIDPPEAAPDLTLLDTQGQPFHLAAQRNHVTVLYFGYTNCPDVCPLTLAHLAAVRHALGASASALQVVFITVDPDRDTAPVIRQYLDKFDASFIGLRGDWNELLPVYQAYGAAAAPHTDPNSRVDHSAYLYALDRSNRWRLLFSPDTSVDDLTADLRQLIGGGG